MSDFDFSLADELSRTAKYQESADDHLSAFNSTNEPDSENVSELKKGWRAGWDQLQGLGGGLLAWAGDAMDSESMTRAGMEIYNRNMEEAAAHGGNVREFTSLADDFSLDRLADYALYTTGNVLPTVLTSVAGGGVGGFAGKQIAKKAASKAIAKQAQRRIAAGEAEEAALKNATEHVTKRIAQKYGAPGGAFVVGSGMETGSIAGEMHNELGEIDADTALTFGMMAGAVDTVGLMPVLKRMGIGKFGKEEIVKSIPLAVAKQALRESGTEGLQTVIERGALKWVDENKDIFTPEGWHEIINASAAGFMGGAVMGTPSAAMAKYRKPEDDLYDKDKDIEDQSDRLSDELAGDEAPDNPNPVMVHVPTFKERMLAISANNKEMEKLRWARGVDQYADSVSRPIQQMPNFAPRMRLSEIMDRERERAAASGGDALDQANASGKGLLSGAIYQLEHLPVTGELMPRGEGALPYETNRLPGSGNIIEGRLNPSGELPAPPDFYMSGPIAGNANNGMEGMPTVSRRSDSGPSLYEDGTRYLPPGGNTLYMGGDIPPRGNASNGLDGMPTVSNRMDSDPAVNLLQAQQTVDRVQGGERLLKLGQSEYLNQLAQQERAKQMPPSLQDQRLLNDDYRQSLELTVARLDANRKNVNSKHIDPATDDLFTAIAKQGGINKAELSRDGFDPEDMTAKAGVRNVFTSKGRSVDDLAETLAEHGYLSNRDPEELKERIRAQFRGQEQFSDSYAPDYMEDGGAAVRALSHKDFEHSPARVQSAIRKALSGEVLTGEQTEIVKGALELIGESRRQLVPDIQQERKERNQLRRAIRDDRARKAAFDRDLAEMPMPDYTEFEASVFDGHDSLNYDERLEVEAIYDAMASGVDEAIINELELRAKDTKAFVDSIYQAIAGVKRLEQRQGNQYAGNEKGQAQEAIRETERDRQRVDRAREERGSTTQENEALGRLGQRGLERWKAEQPVSGEMSPDFATHYDLPEQELLSSYTEKELVDNQAKRQEQKESDQAQERQQEAKAKADQERDAFTLTGSDRAADVAMARGQSDIFSDGESQTQTEEQGYTATKVDQLEEDVLAAKDSTANWRKLNLDDRIGELVEQVRAKEGSNWYKVMINLESRYDKDIQDGFKEARRALGVAPSSEKSDILSDGYETDVGSKQVESDQADQDVSPETETASSDADSQKAKPASKTKADPVKKDDGKDDSNINRYESFWERLDEADKSLTVEDVKAFFNELRTNKAAVIAELSKLTVSQLKKYYRGWDRNGMKKAELVEAVYEDFVTSFGFVASSDNVMSLSGIGQESRFDGVAKKLANLTDEQLHKNLSEKKARREEQISEYKEKISGAHNPETLEDYRNAVRLGLSKDFTPEQWAEYDRLLSDERIEHRKARETKTVESVEGEISYTTHETTHAKKGVDLFVVSLDERLERGQYDDLNGKAKQLGGYYSSYNKQGAIPGFQFYSEEARNDFLKLLNGESVERTKQSKDRTSALEELADRIDGSANDSLNQDRKTNTHKRAREAGYAIERASNELERAARLRKLIDAIKSGTSKYLQNLKYGVDEELLHSLWNKLRWNARNKDEGKELTGYDRNNGHTLVWQDGVTPEQKVRFAEYPLTRMSKDAVARIAREMEKTKGFRQAGLKLLRDANVSTDDTFYLANHKWFDKFREFVKNHESNQYVSEYAKEYFRLQRMGIENLPMLRAALLEYNSIVSGVTVTAQSKTTEKLKYASLKGQYKDLDFFNTTPEAAAEVIHWAQLEEGMAVLEPSAGAGHLADAAAEVVGKENVTTNEYAFGLNEFLKEKGYQGTKEDFLQLKPKPEYDRVVMNPPFSKDQEITHIEHAYKFLKPGGRLVAIVSSMAGNRQNKRNQAFREWLDSLGADEHALPDGSFKGAINPTNVSTKIIVIDKPIKSSGDSATLASVKESGSTGKEQSNSNIIDQDLLDFQPIGMAELKAAIAPILRLTGQNVEIVDSYHELPEAARNKVRRLGGMEWDFIWGRLPKDLNISFGKLKGNLVPGVYHNGKYYAIREFTPNVETAVRTALHELIGHKGVNRVLGANAGKVFSQIALSQNPDLMKKLATKYKLDMNNPAHLAELGAEYVAHLAETDKRPTLVNVVVAKIRNILRKLFPDIGWNKSDVLHLIEQGRKALESNSAEMDQRESDAMDGFGKASLARVVDSDELSELDKLGLGEKEKRGIAGLIEKARNMNWTAARESFFERAYEGGFDGLIGLKRAEEAAGITDFAQSGYVGARLATGVADVMHAVLHYGAPKWKDGVLQEKGGTEGLLTILGSLGKDMNDWLAWVAGNRAQELLDQGRENNLTQDDINKLKARAKGKEKKFTQAHKQYAALNKSMLDMAEGAGLIDPESRKEWESEWYIPFYRREEAEGAAALMAPRTKRGLSHQTAGIKKLSGGNVPTNDLLENILQNWIKLADASMKNSAMLKAVDNLKDTDYLSDESFRYTKAVVSKSEINSRIRKDRKYRESVAEFLGLERSTASNTLIDKLAKLDNEGFESLWAITAPSDPDIIRVQRNGKAEYYRVHDEGVLRAVTYLNSQGFNDAITKTGRFFKRLLTTGVTASPDFIVRNFIRDAVHAWAINPDGFKFGRDSVKGIVGAFKEDAEYRELMFSGASFQGGYAHGTDPEASAQIIRRALEKKGLSGPEIEAYQNSLINSGEKLWHTVQRGWQRYREIGDKFENSNRLATYKAAIAAGKPVAQAAFEAKDLMDYSMRGNYQALIWLTDMVPFMNARMQGMSKLVRAAKENPKQMKAAVFKIVMFSAALAMMNDDDERYEELPDWDKDANWHVWLGDEHFRIPKPFEIGIVAGTIPERLIHVMSGSQDSEKLWWSIKHNTFETLGVNPTPQFAMPIIENVANRQFFFDRPIEGMADEGKLPEARYNEHTSSTMRKMGEWLGMSPKQLEHLWNGYLGTLGMYGLHAADVVVDNLTGRAPKAETGPESWPVLKAFYKGSGPNKSVQYTTDLYDRLREVDQVYRTIRDYREQGLTEKADELQKSNVEKLKHRRDLNQARKQLGDIRKKMDQIERSRMLSPETKRRKLDELTEKRNELSRKVEERTRAAF